MIDLQDVHKMWEIDCVIDKKELDEDGRKCAKLHSKYLQLYSMSKLQLKKAEMKQKTLLLDKWLYYNGKMSEDEIAAKKWAFDPFNGLKVMKGDMNRYYDADIDIQRSEELIEYWKTVNSTLKEIMESIKWRAQTVKNMIDWRRFEAGV